MKYLLPPTIIEESKETSRYDKSVSFNLNESHWNLMGDGWRTSGSRWKSSVLDSSWILIKSEKLKKPKWKRKVVDLKTWIEEKYSGNKVFLDKLKVIQYLKT